MLLLLRGRAWPVSRFGTRGRQGKQAPMGGRGNTDLMQQRTLQTLYGYWNEVRAGRLAPQRLEIEPSRIAGILSETFMLERIDAASYQYRLAGTRLCEMFGSELRGRNFLDGWSEADRQVLARDLGTVCEQGAVAVISLEGSSDSRHRVELEAVLLPLVHAGHKIGRIIGAMSATSTPHWLDNDPLRSRRLLRHELIWPDGRPHAVVERWGRQAPFLPARAQMRIVKTGRRQFRVFEGGRTSGKLDKS
jgi:hypothetical protein